VVVCDYAVSNIRSVERAVEAAGGEAVLTADPAVVATADGVILPGVGAFGAAMDALFETGLSAAVIEHAARHRPLLGVCLGFQLLFEASDESGGRDGLGLLPGRVVRLDPSRGKVPHMGWNTLSVARPCALLQGVPDGSHLYFVHSYAALTDASIVVATCDYNGEVVAVCERDSIVATQFHPEKSGRDGLRIYANFVRMCAGERPAQMRAATA